MRASLFAIAAATASVTPQPVAAPTQAADTASAPIPAAAHPSPLPPFAAKLAQNIEITGGDDWDGPNDQQAWAALATAAPEDRQQVRWDYALSLIGQSRGPEALGVLETMRADDKDLALVSPFQMAIGAALTLADRNDEAVQALASPDLATNPEACAWRLRALVHVGETREAAREINCAVPAINGRAPIDRRPFMSAAAEAAIDIGQAQPALGWLKLFDDRDPGANLLRGRAMLAIGDVAGGLFRLARAEESGGPQILAAVTLAKIEAGLAMHHLKPDDAYQQLETLRYGWRGDGIEQRALKIEYKITSDAQDTRGALRVGATLFRYFKPDSDSRPMLAQMQGWLRTTLDPAGGISLPEAAGIYWDYKELAPIGLEGDTLALQLAGRLQSAGLYARAAELLQYQVTKRRQSVAQGPLSVKVASLHILSGRPDRALEVLRQTEQPDYNDAMRWDRKRIEAVALHQLGKDDAAVAALDEVPDGGLVIAEIHWREKNWGAFVTESEALLPKTGPLSAPAQAAVLREAVALAMLGREDKLQALHARYAEQFKTLPSGRAFDMLTRKADTIDPGAVSEAMGAIPEASPAGAVGDLLDAGAI